MRAHTLTLTALAIFLGASFAHAAIIYQQNPGDNLETKSSPGITRSEAADDFDLSTIGVSTVRGLVFWGNLETTGNFEVTFYSDVNTGTAGTEINPFTQSIGVSSMIVTQTSFKTGGSVYEYRADLPIDVPLPAAVSYIGIRYAGGTTWGWYENTTSGFHSSRNNPANTGTWAGSVFNSNLAFQLHDTSVVPEPGSIAVLSFAAVGLAFGAWRRRKKQKPATD